MGEMVPEIHSIEKCDFLKPIHSQIISLLHSRGKLENSTLPDARKVIMFH